MHVVHESMIELYFHFIASSPPTSEGGGVANINLKVFTRRIETILLWFFSS